LNWTCRGDQIKERYLLGQWLKVEKAHEPSLILWENLGFSRKNRCIRQMMTSGIAFCMIIFTLIFIVYAKNKDDQI
jgi:hypothetical protein